MIKELKRKYDLTKDEDVLALYAKLQSGEYDLSGTEGRRFDDEVYELAMQAKRKSREAVGNRIRKKAEEKSLC